MKNVKVLFLQDVPGVALAGDVKEVRRGFARNYLFPRGLATLATQDHLARIEKIRRQAEERRLKEQKDMEALAQALEGREVVVRARVAPSGEYYGSIGPGDIAEELSKLLEREVDRKVVELEEPITQPGEYEFTVRLHPKVTARMRLVAEKAE